MGVFPNAEFYTRRTYKIKEISQFAINRGFTDIIIANDYRGELCIILHSYYFLTYLVSMTMIHLPMGPTAYFRLSGVKLRKQIFVIYYFLLFY